MNSTVGFFIGGAALKAEEERKRAETAAQTRATF
jgi:hypothetical protein